MFSVNCFCKSKKKVEGCKEWRNLSCLIWCLLWWFWSGLVLLCMNILNLSHLDNFNCTNLWEKKNSKYIALKGFQSSEREIQPFFFIHRCILSLSFWGFGSGVQWRSPRKNSASLHVAGVTLKTHYISWRWSWRYAYTIVYLVNN